MAVAAAAAVVVVEVVDANASVSVAALGLGALVPEDDIDFVVAVVGGSVSVVLAPVLSSVLLLLLLPLLSRFDEDMESVSDEIVTDVSDTTSSVGL